MNEEQAIRHLKRANEAALATAAKGRHPFGAVLVAAVHRDFWRHR